MKNQFEPKPANKAKSTEERMGSGPDGTFEISGEIIEKAFTSPEFVKTLQKTVEKVLKHRREWGFLIAKEKLKDKFYYSNPIGGDEETNTALGVAHEELEEIFLKKGMDESDWLRLGSLHFHGYESYDQGSSNFIPSGEDISGSVAVREDFGVPQVEMIASILSPTEIEALVYRESAEYSIAEKPAMLEELMITLPELFDTQAKQEEVIKTLQHYGFKVGIVRFSNGQLTKESRDFIRLLGMKGLKSNV